MKKVLVDRIPDDLLKKVDKTWRADPDFQSRNDFIRKILKAAVEV